MHATGTSPEYSAWWTCDYNAVATQMACALEVSGDVNDNTQGPASGVFPDARGNVVAFATAEVVTQGRFGERECGQPDASGSVLMCNSDGTGGKGTMSWGASVPTPGGMTSASSSVPTTTQGSTIGGLEATRSASGSVAAASTGAAVRFSGEGVAAVVLAGAAALMAS